MALIINWDSTTEILIVKQFQKQLQTKGAATNRTSLRRLKVSNELGWLS